MSHRHFTNLIYFEEVFTVFIGAEIEALVGLLNERQVPLYHSCQFTDFKSYIQMGGIPSRKLLSECELAFTPFASDETDRGNGVWDKVFLNPLDFGEGFAFGAANVPTTYGPIAFVVIPDALIEADDVAICLQTAGIKGFQREEESSKITMENVNRLFLYAQNQRYWNKAQIKPREQLEKEFNDGNYVSNPEISCSFRTEKIPLHFVSYLLLDPYSFRERLLRDAVLEWLDLQGVNLDVKVRGCWPQRYRMYNELASILQNGIVRLHSLAHYPGVSDDLCKWAISVSENRSRNQWDRYAAYFYKGTLEPLT